MTISLLFWVLMVLWLVFGFWQNWGSGFPVIGSNLLLWVLIALLGWKTFGPLIQG
jgi:hypothetical protein